VAAFLVGLLDTVGRAFLPDILTLFINPIQAASLAQGLSSMLIYILMALVLVVRPAGLFPAPGR
ncbi:hypothetical protein, partial [Streptomyces niveiscabiei]